MISSYFFGLRGFITVLLDMRKENKSMDLFGIWLNVTNILAFLSCGAGVLLCARGCSPLAAGSVIPEMGICGSRDGPLSNSASCGCRNPAVSHKQNLLWLCSILPLDWELTPASAPALTSSSSAAPCLGQGHERSLRGAAAAAARHSSQQAWRGDAAQIGTRSPSPADIRRARILSQQIKH